MYKKMRTALPILSSQAYGLLNTKIQNITVHKVLQEDNEKIITRKGIEAPRRLMRTGHLQQSAVILGHYYIHFNKGKEPHQCGPFL